MPGKVGQAPDDLVGLLDHGELVVTHRDKGRPEAGNIGCLADGIGEEARGYVPREAAKLHLRPHGRVTFESSDGYEGEIEDGEFREFRDRRLEGDRRDVGIDADGQVVESKIEDVAPHVPGPAAVVREGLQVRNQDGLLVEVLERDTGVQRAGIVSEMEWTGRPVAGENDLAHAANHRYRPGRMSTKTKEEPMTPVHRALQGDVLVFNLADEMQTVREELASGHARIARTLVKEGPLRVTLIGLSPGGALHAHHAEAPITIQVLDGKIELEVGGAVRSLVTGALAALDGSVRHAVRSSGGGLFLLTLAAAPQG